MSSPAYARGCATAEWCASPESYAAQHLLPSPNTFFAHVLEWWTPTPPKNASRDRALAIVMPRVVAARSRLAALVDVYTRPSSCATLRVFEHALRAAAARAEVLLDLFGKMLPHRGLSKSASALVCSAVQRDALTDADLRTVAVALAAAVTDVYAHVPPGSTATPPARVCQSHAAIVDALTPTLLRARAHLIPNLLIFALRAYISYMARCAPVLLGRLRAAHQWDRISAQISDACASTATFVLAAPLGDDVFARLLELESARGGDLRKGPSSTFMYFHPGPCIEEITRIISERYASLGRDGDANAFVVPVRAGSELHARVLELAERADADSLSVELLAHVGVGTGSTDALRDMVLMINRGVTRREIVVRAGHISLGALDIVRTYLYALHARTTTFTVELPRAWAVAQTRAVLLHYGAGDGTLGTALAHTLARAYYCAKCGALCMSACSPHTYDPTAKNDAESTTYGPRGIAVRVDPLRGWTIDSRRVCLACRKAGDGAGDVRVVDMIGRALVLRGRTYVVCPRCGVFTPFNVGHYTLVRQCYAADAEWEAAGNDGYAYTCGHCRPVQWRVAIRAHSCLLCGAMAGAEKGIFVPMQAEDGASRYLCRQHASQQWVVKAAANGFTAEELRRLAGETASNRKFILQRGKGGASA